MAREITFKTKDGQVLGEISSDGKEQLSKKWKKSEDTDDKRTGTDDTDRPEVDRDP